MKKVHLLVIDPQRDFCDKTGALSVAGADEDMKRLGKMVARLKDKLHDIHVTLDSHHLVHIAHPIFWKDRNGNNPNPFTIITADEVAKGEWRTAIPSHQRLAQEYVASLDKNGRYPLCIWPAHCLIGTEGHNVVPSLMGPLLDWERDFAVVDKVTKGSNPFTEHYSAVQADVPDPKDPSTGLNVQFIRSLEDADEILVAGEASSHCLANTVRDIANNFADPSAVAKFVLLKDATSPVPGFEAFEKNFVDEMTKRGMKVSTTTEYLM